MSKTQIVSGGITDGTIATADIADDAVTTAKTSYSASPFRNIIINGDMSIAQRGTSSTSTGYVADRFNFRVSNTDQFAYTHSQSTTVPTGQGFASSWKLDVTTAETTLDSDEEVALQTRLEARLLQSLKFGTSSAETLTLSFWVRSNKTGTYGIYLRQHDAGKNYVASYTISSADTWEKKSISISGNTADTIANDNGIGFWINWTLAAGSSLDGATMDSWHTAATEIAPTGQVDITDSTSNEWYITGVQLEVGTSASDFEFLPTDVNLKRCQRYHYRYNKDKQSHVGLLVGFGNGGSDYNSIHLPLPTNMRANPSLSTDPASGSLAIRWWKASGGTGTVSSYTTLSSFGNLPTDGSCAFAFNINGFGGNLVASAPNGLELEGACLILDSEL